MSFDAIGLAFTWNGVWRLTHSDVADALAALGVKFLPPELRSASAGRLPQTDQKRGDAGTIQIGSRDSVT